MRIFPCGARLVSGEKCRCLTFTEYLSNLWYSLKEASVGKIKRRKAKTLSETQKTERETAHGIPREAYFVEPTRTVDLTQATAATINQLRQAFRDQAEIEQLERGGKRDS